MDNELKQILKYSSEGACLDYKLKQYELGKHAKKNELLKDISAMVNHPSDETKYIIIGVKEKNGVASEFHNIEDLIDQAKYQQFIESSIEPKIEFEYRALEYDGNNLACFIIKENNNRPYLFSKNIQNPISQKLEYSIGNGFIRTGTSTRKLNRDDFELIYSKRLKNKDRKSDIKITPYLRKCYGNKFKELEVYYLDFQIDNLSNKSLSFDIEANIFYNEGFNIIKRFDLEGKLGEDKSGLSGSLATFRTDNTVFHMSFEEKHDSIHVERNRRLNESNAVQIAQNDKEEDVFLKEVLVYKKESSNLIVDMVLRSDDFVDGAKEERFEIEI